MLTAEVEDIWQQAPSLLGFEFKEARPFARERQKAYHTLKLQVRRKFTVRSASPSGGLTQVLFAS